MTWGYHQITGMYHSYHQLILQIISLISPLWNMSIIPTHIISYIYIHTSYIYIYISHISQTLIIYIYIYQISNISHISNTKWYLPWCHDKPSIFSAIFSAKLGLKLGDLPPHQQLEGGLEKPWESREKMMGTYPKMVGKWENDGKISWKDLNFWESRKRKLRWFLWTSWRHWALRVLSFQAAEKIGCLLVYHRPLGNCCGTPIYFWGKPVRAMVKAWYMWYGNLIIGDSWSWFYKSLSLDWWSSSSIRKNNPCFDETGGLSFGWLYINTFPLHPIVFR